MNNINEILIKIKEMDYDKETCIAELISYNPESNFVEPMEQMKLLRQVRALAEENNISLEENRDEFGGLGFYVKFKKINNSDEFKINNSFVFKDDETKVEYQKYLDEVNEYNRKIANGETPDKDLSTITDEFKQKFIIEEKNDSEINNDMLDELKEKLDQTINSNLSYEEQIQNINKRIEELNNEEDK